MELLSAFLSSRNFTVEWSSISLISYQVICQLIQFFISIFFSKTIDFIASTLSLPLPWFRLSFENIVLWLFWTVLTAIWFNIKLVSSVGSRFFDSSQLKLTISFHSLRFPWFTIFGIYRMQTWCGSKFAG